MTTPDDRAALTDRAAFELFCDEQGFDYDSKYDDDRAEVRGAWTTWQHFSASQPQPVNRADGDAVPPRAEVLALAQRVLDQGPDNMSPEAYAKVLVGTMYPDGDAVPVATDELAFRGETFSNWWERHQLDASDMDYKSAEQGWLCGQLSAPPASTSADAQERFLDYWCAEVPDNLRAKWRESVNDLLDTPNASDKLQAAWDSWKECAAAPIAADAQGPAALTLPPVEEMQAALSKANEAISQLEKERTVTREQMNTPIGPLAAPIASALPAAQPGEKS